MRHAVIQPPAHTARASTVIPPGQRLGSLIGGAFGVSYVEVNAGSLADPWATALRIAAGVAFVGLAVLLARNRGPGTGVSPAGFSGFRGSYWLVVTGEAAAILAGAAILNGPAALPRAAVAWVSVVVGVHFLVLAVIWRLPLFRYLGAGIAACGAAGLAAAVAGAGTAVVGGSGGVLPGWLLLIASYWGATHAAGSDTGATTDSRDQHG